MSLLPGYILVRVRMGILVVVVVAVVAAAVMVSGMGQSSSPLSLSMLNLIPRRGEAGRGGEPTRLPFAVAAVGAAAVPVDGDGGVMTGMYCAFFRVYLGIGPNEATASMAVVEVVVEVAAAVVVGVALVAVVVVLSIVTISRLPRLEV